jgi:hypothetical protein
MVNGPGTSDEAEDPEQATQNDNQAKTDERILDTSRKVGNVSISRSVRASLRALRRRNEAVLYSSNPAVF